MCPYASNAFAQKCCGEVSAGDIQIGEIRAIRLVEIVVCFRYRCMTSLDNWLEEISRLDLSGLEEELMYQSSEQTILEHTSVHCI